MANRWSIPIVGLCLLSGALLGAASSEPTAAKLLERIDRDGGDGVIRELWAAHEPFEFMCAQISTGDPQWLQVASRLRPFSDAGASLSLDISMARALPKQPSAVLALIEPPWRLEMVCGAPFIEPPAEEVQAYLENAISVLSQPRSEPLEERRVACLYHLRTAAKRIASQ
ncbi:MAG TPA: hypothetical protein VKA53_03810 [Thermoanaerobaculia bacterium]|nr:hypothetical protein [Thermoanaerobaculia bacterium]